MLPPSGRRLGHMPHAVAPLRFYLPLQPMKEARTMPKVSRIRRSPCNVGKL